MSHRMNRLKITGFAFAPLCLFIAGQGLACSVTDMKGRILDKAPAGDPKIAHTDGTSTDAKYPELLCAGDHIIMAPHSKLNIRLNGQRTPLRAGDAPLNFPVPNGGEYHGQSILASLANYLSRPPVETSQATFARGPGGEIIPPSSSELSPVGAQYLVTGMTGPVVLAWNGEAATLNLTSGSGSSLRPTHEHRWAELDLSDVRGDAVQVNTTTGDLVWNFSYTDAPPRVPGLPDKVTSNSDRVARAVWILREGPKEWRSYALSEVSVLSDDDFVAHELWHALEIGDLEKVLNKGSTEK